MPEPLRFTPNARYGLALMGVVFATYLNISTDFTTYIQGTNYAGSVGGDFSALTVVQFAMIVVLYVVSFAIFPVSGERRLAAITLACVVLFLWATLGIERGVGNVREPIDFWTFVLNQGFVALLVSVGGWFILHKRHWLSAVVLAVILVPPFVSKSLIQSAVTTGSYTLVLETVVFVAAVAAAWLGWLIDRIVRRSGGSRGVLAAGSASTGAGTGDEHPAL
jgi:hypothetical protein